MERAVTSPLRCASISPAKAGVLQERGPHPQLGRARRSSGPSRGAFLHGDEASHVADVRCATYDDLLVACARADGSQAAPGRELVRRNRTFSRLSAHEQ
jgi:hypothetical protein